MDTTTCPECGTVAEVRERFALDSTDGPIEHARIVCVGRHWFLLPLATLAGAPRGRRAEAHLPADPAGRPRRS